MGKKLRGANQAEKPGVGATAPVAPRARPEHDEVTRIAAARILDVSVSTVRKLERRGALVPVRVDDGGVHYFARLDVEAVAAERGKGPPGPHRAKPPRDREESAGVVASQAFALLARGRPALELVTTLRLTPKMAEELVEQFKRVRALGAVHAVDTPAARDEPATCEGCGEACARYCAACVQRFAAAARTPPLPQVDDADG